MRILISGSTGMLGSPLVQRLRAEGHTVTRLVRSPAQASGDSVVWSPDEGDLDAVSIEGHDAVIHLAGANIAGARWTAAVKTCILDSRIKGTGLLARAMAELTRPPNVFICASATGFYGDRGDEVLTEDSPPGDGFLAEVCRAWEAECQPAAAAGCRVVQTRTGVVLDRHGGALAKLLLPFKLGLGGRLGTGRQYMSWISLEDQISAFVHVLTHEDIHGPVNFVAPTPVTNAEFTQVLGKVLSRPTIIPVPSFALRLAAGEMADALLLASTRAVPQQLMDSGFSFRHRTIGEALAEILS